MVSSAFNDTLNTEKETQKLSVTFDARSDKIKQLCATEGKREKSTGEINEKTV